MAFISIKKVSFCRNEKDDDNVYRVNHKTLRAMAAISLPD